jgi:ABC-type polysaccharide/polyol phosphate export permease
MRKPQLYPFIWDVFTIFLNLFGGILIAIQLRRDIGIGSTLGEEYATHPPLLFIILPLMSLIAAYIHRSYVPRPNKRSRFFAVLGAVAGVFLAVVVFLPDVSLLTLLYFVISTVLISLICLWWTPTRQPLSEGISQLWRSRELLVLWTRYNAQSRYSQTVLGVLWIVALPLATSLILAFVFSHVMRINAVDNEVFVPFLLTGLTFWNMFTQSVQNGAMSILLKLELINQIYFPREILVIVKLGETLVDLTFTFLTLLLINWLFGLPPNVNFIFLPFVLGIQLALTLGVMFYVSYLCVFVRDFVPLISVALQMLFYLTPIIYPLSVFPEYIQRTLALVNPLAPIITAYRDIIVFNKPPDFISLFTVSVIAGLILYTGYMLFKANEGRLTDHK